MSALYEISKEYAKLMAEDIDPEMITDTIEGLEGEFSDKIEQLISIVKNELAYSESLKAESKKLADRAKVTENKAENIKRYIAESMATLNKKTIKSGVHQVTIRKPSVMVDITDLNSLPPSVCEYETSIKADKKAIKKMLVDGEIVSGASLKYGKQSLTIK